MNMSRCGRSLGGWAGPPRRCRGSWSATAAAAVTEPRLPIGMRGPGAAPEAVQVGDQPAATGGGGGQTGRGLVTAADRRLAGSELPRLTGDVGSHETIYLTLFVQPRGALKRELATHLRTRRMKRRSRAHTSRGHGRGQIVDAVAISQRPAEVEERAVPGHWEGDLLIGSGRSQIATLVERSTRFVMLVGLSEGRAAAPVLPEGHQHRRVHPRTTRRDRRQAQRTPSTDPELDDTVGETSRGVVALTS
jgi:hypothetical protein